MLLESSMHSHNSVSRIVLYCTCTAVATDNKEMQGGVCVSMHYSMTPFPTRFIIPVMIYILKPNDISRGKASILTVLGCDSAIAKS